MKRKEAEYRIKEIISRSEDIQNVYTPFELCEKMLDKLPMLNTKINVLILFNLEFLYTIRERIEDLSNVWFMTPSDLKIQAAKNMGILENHIIKYEYNIKELNKIKENMPKFDVVVGNPPYQGDKTPDSKGRTSIASKIWPKFVEKSNEICKDGGYVSLIIPSTFIIKNNKSHKQIFDKNVIEITNNVEFSGPGVAVSYFLLKNEPRISDNIKITDFKTKKSFILEYDKSLFYSPRDLNETGNSILKKTINNETLPKIISSMESFEDVNDYSENKDKTFKWPGYIKHNKIIYFKTPHNFQTSEKVIVFRVLKRKGPKLILNAIYDDKNGIVNHYGNGISFILVHNKHEGENLIKYLNSNLINFIISSIHISALINIPLLKSIPAIDLKNSLSDKDIYNYFNLTDEEIKYIES